MIQKIQLHMNSIFVRIMGLFLALGTLCTLILLLTSFLIVKSNTEGNFTQNLTSIAEAVYDLVETTDKAAKSAVARGGDNDAEQFSNEMFNNLNKKIREIKIGKTGYVYIVDTRGVLINHPEQQGKNISSYPFIREMLKNKNGTIIYEWQDKKTLASYKYYQPLGWYVVAKSYFSEFAYGAMRKFVIAFVILVPLLAGIIFVSIYLMMRRLVLNPLSNAKSVAESIKTGDLTIPVSHVNDDEIGIFFNSLEEMLESLRGIIASIKSNTDRLTGSSRGLDDISKRLSQMSQDQAAAMEQTAASLEETLASMEQIAAKSEDQYSKVDKNADRMGAMANEAKNSYNDAESVSNLMNKTALDASKGAEDLNSMVREMQNIKESTSKIEEIIKIISDISEQVNLLSLNAAIEAARAGEHGKGFAVVADEISKLADETATSAKTITSLVKEGNLRVDSGTEIVNRTAATFHKIINTIETVTSSISKFSGTLKMLAETSSEAQTRADGIKQISNQVSTATHEQMNTNREISMSVEKVNASSQELVNYADTVMKASEEIKELTDEIDRQLGLFRLN